MTRIRTWLALVILTLLLSGCAGAGTAVNGRLDTTPRLAIVSAFEPELEKLRGAAQVSRVEVVNGRSHYLGRLEGRDVVLLLSGFSMVNAAMTTQALLDRFAVEGIVFSGIAGGVNPNLGVGDVTVPAEWGQYQEQAFARETPSGWDAGRFGGEFPNYGMMFPHRATVVRRDGEADRLERRFWFPADDTALEVARRVAGDVRLSRCTGGGECLGATPRVVVGGKGVSGPTFVDNAAYRQWVWQTFQADALDMETAAVAHVAYVNNTPYLAFRSLSDLAGGGPGGNEVVTFFQLAANNSAKMVIAFLEAWK